MKPGIFKEEYIAIILRELLKGLDYLHNENKLHRGLFSNYLYINIMSLRIFNKSIFVIIIDVKGRQTVIFN